MQDKHWTDDELIAGLYGIGSDNAHLERCPECRRRSRQLQQRSEALRQADPQVSPALMAAQRRSVLQRLERRPLWRPLRWIPAAATAMLLLAVMMFLPTDKTKVAESTRIQAVKDTQLFEDAFTKAYSMETAAAQPLQSLFEVKP